MDNNRDKPAFVVVSDSLCDGLTKREYFAALAMQGLLSRERAWTAAALAEQSLAAADAVLAKANEP